MYELKIKVENDTLVIRGNPEESVGCVLRGFITLKNKERLRTKAINLKLTGKIKLQQKHKDFKQDYVIFEHQWQFTTHKTTLEPNTHNYPFELVFPGNMAESVESLSFGSLSYKLKATVERPFLPNLVQRKSLWIIRQTSSGMFPYHITNASDKLKYNISLPGHTFTRGQDIPIDFLLIPTQSLHVRHLSCFLKEYSVHNNRLQSRIVRFLTDESFPKGSSEWHKTELMTIPTAPSAIQMDADNKYFKIYHKLKFTVSMIDELSELYEIRASMPIQIVHYDDDLPSYDCAWQSESYHPYLPDDAISLPSYSDGLPAYEL